MFVTSVRLGWREHTEGRNITCMKLESKLISTNRQIFKGIIFCYGLYRRDTVQSPPKLWQKTDCVSIVCQSLSYFQCRSLSSSKCILMCLFCFSFLQVAKTVFLAEHSLPFIFLLSFFFFTSYPVGRYSLVFYHARLYRHSTFFMCTSGQLWNTYIIRPSHFPRLLLLQTQFLLNTPGNRLPK